MDCENFVPRDGGDDPAVFEKTSDPGAVNPLGDAEQLAANERSLDSAAVEMMLSAVLDVERPDN